MLRPRRRSSSGCVEVTADQMAILISHRFSTVRMADRIVVLDRGRVEEAGTHEELMERNGRYAHFSPCRPKAIVRGRKEPARGVGGFGR